MAGDALIPFLAEHGDALRAGLAQAEEPAATDAARCIAHPEAAGALAVPFVRPSRWRHRDRILDLRVRAGDPAARDVLAVPVAGGAPGRWHAQQGGVDLFLDDISFAPPQGPAGAPGGNELRAPFNGKVIALPVEPGAAVEKGATLIVIESMKLEHALAAPRSGRVKSVHVQPGQQAATGQVLVSFEAP
jgi:geranyl-CoA carboxylase alpha subunit